MVVTAALSKVYVFFFNYLLWSFWCIKGRFSYKSVLCPQILLLVIYLHKILFSGIQVFEDDNRNTDAEHSPWSRFCPSYCNWSVLFNSHDRSARNVDIILLFSRRAKLKCNLVRPIAHIIQITDCVKDHSLDWYVGSLTPELILIITQAVGGIS